MIATGLKKLFPASNPHGGEHSADDVTPRTCLLARRDRQDGGANYAGSLFR
ncbi:hypothetical protein [uncultured Sphingomonas sp.]|uniref:hypothetical protein n=1 Tax=uncultured Sphingomonas sp. TaxID=158754 RepID=UPI003749A77B